MHKVRALASMCCLMLTSCYGHYSEVEYRPVSCRPRSIDWFETTPNIDPIDAACADYTRRTGVDAKALLSKVSLFIKRHDGKSIHCEHTPYQTCTMQVAHQAYWIEYRDDLIQGQYLWHEILHVLLNEEGYRGEAMHHAIMKQRGWM